MPITYSSAPANPTTTVATVLPSDLVRDNPINNLYATKSVAASGTFVLPWTFAAGSIIDVAATNATNVVYGRIIVLSASAITVAAASGLSTTAGANVLVPSISSGVVTLTANATFTTTTVNATVVV